MMSKMTIGFVATSTVVDEDDEPGRQGASSR
jgi:hypothetical protein